MRCANSNGCRCLPEPVEIRRSGELTPRRKTPGQWRCFGEVTGPRLAMVLAGTPVYLRGMPRAVADLQLLRTRPDLLRRRLRPARPAAKSTGRRRALPN